jgi:adenine-specific DNA-methyltransferase
MQYVYIKNNTFPQFEKVLKKVNIRCNDLIFLPLSLVLDFLNKIKPIKGFIYNNYSSDGTANLEKPRIYFSDYNAQKIDTVRTQIEDWNIYGLLLEEEYFILLA